MSSELRLGRESSSSAGGGGAAAAAGGTIRHSTTSVEARQAVAAKLGGILGQSAGTLPTAAAAADKKSVQDLLTMMFQGKTAEVNDYLNSLSKEERDAARAQLKTLMESAAAMF